MALGAVAASPSLSLAYIVGGDIVRYMSESWAVTGGDAPPSLNTSPSLITVLGVHIPTCDLHLHIASASLLLKRKYFSVSYLES